MLAQGIASVAMVEDMKKRLLSRRKFDGLCAALGSSLPIVSTTIAALSSASAFAAAPGAASNGARRTVKFYDGVVARRSARDLHNSEWGDVRKLLRKKRCALVFRDADRHG